MTPYLTPGAFDNAVKAYAKKVAKELGSDVNFVLRSFYFHRLAARVFRHDPQGWLLKGGQALLMRYPAQARLSRDMDLQRSVTDSVDEAVPALNLAAALDLDDYFRFASDTLERHADEIGGAKQWFTVFIGTRRVDRISVDLVTGRTPTGTPEIAQLAPGITIPWPDDWPPIRLYPLPDHIADKICAIHEWRRNIPSSRFRDLADILLISQREVLNSAEVCLALQSEVSRRTALGTDLRLPSDFEAPHSNWILGYPPRAVEVSGLEGCTTLAEALQAAKAFLNPLLIGTATGVWDPKEQVWA